MKNTNIIPQGAITLHNGEAAQPGEASDLLNLRQREDALEVVGPPLKIAHIPAGDRLIAVDHDRYITLHDHDIMWGATLLATTAGEVTSTHTAGQFLVIATTQGYLYLHRTPQGYDLLHPSQAIPQLHLTEVDESTLLANIDAHQFTQPLAQWQYPLPSGETAGIHEIVQRAWKSLQHQAHEEGRFTSPILVRYGVRLWDDSYLWLSCPILLGSKTIKNNYRTSTEAVITDSKFSGIAASTLSIDTFRLGITVVQGIDRKWLDLVKSIDIFTASGVEPVNTCLLDYRMGTTNVGTRRYVFEMGLVPRTCQSIVSELLDHRWELAASTSQLGTLNNGTFQAVNAHNVAIPVFPNKTTAAVNYLPASTTMLTLGQCREIMENCNREPVPASTLSHNGTLYCGGGAVRLKNPWTALSLFAGNIQATPCQVVTTLRIKTVQGEVTLSHQENYSYTPQHFSPLLVASDIRAVSLRYEVTSGGTTQVIDRTLVPHDAGAVSLCLQENASHTPFTAGSADTTTTDAPVTDAGSKMWCSRMENPFILNENQRLTGTRITAIAVACRPIYSGGFGRYPLYIFTSQGLFALPQRSNGDYGEARIIARKILAHDFTPAEGGGMVWFKTQLGDLCSVNGSTVKDHGRWNKATALAWNDTENELWMRDDDGRIAILFNNDHWTRISTTATQFYNDAGKSLLVDAQGQVMDLQQEQQQNTPKQPVYYLSQPFQVAGIPRQVKWNFLGEDARMTFTLRGERGSSCHGYIINRIRATGHVSTPLTVPLLVQPSGTLRIEIEGTMPCASLFKTVKIEN